MTERHSPNRWQLENRFGVGRRIVAGCAPKDVRGWGTDAPECMMSVDDLQSLPNAPAGERSAALGASPSEGDALSRGVETLPAGTKIPRRLARESSVTLVLSGSFDDLTHLGRNRVAAGAMVVRPTFGCRATIVGCEGAELADLPWRTELTLGGIYDGLDAARLRAILAAGGPDATRMLDVIVARHRPRPPASGRWPDALAAVLRADLHTGIAKWATAHSLTPEAVARGFFRVHGVSPSRFRLELRARAAWVRIVSSSDQLSVIALETGFYDQAHMTRSVAWLTARPPSDWRPRRSKRTTGKSEAVRKGG